jgi:Xaa-Pro aminopeptidase
VDVAGAAGAGTVVGLAGAGGRSGQLIAVLYYLFNPRSELCMFSARIQQVVNRLEAEGLDALLVTSIPNILYLSGFTGSTAMLLICRGQRFFLTDFRYLEQVRQQCDPSYTLIDNTNRKLIEDILPGLPNAAELTRIGFESRHVVYATWEKFQAEGREFLPAPGWIEELRAVKSDAEVALLRAAVQLNERVFTELLSTITAQTTEADLAAEMVGRAIKYGAQERSFTPIIASGDHAAKPHAGFTLRQLVPGAPLTIDMGVLLNGYCSDMTRTVFYKDCPAEWARIYQTVREAKELSQAAVRPGIAGRDVHVIARDHIAAAGFGDYFNHGLGHGVGIEVHEGPSLSLAGTALLEAGNIVTVEPGIYLPGKGGIRIEDMVVVTKSGSENLNLLHTDLTVVG